MALAESNDFQLTSKDIRVAFLQAKTMDIEVFMKPPKDQRIEGWLWKPMCGLDDTSRKFWLKVKETLVDVSHCTKDWDEAFQYWLRVSKLYGSVLTYVEYFFLDGTDRFLYIVLAGVSQRMTVSNIVFILLFILSSLNSRSL